MKTGILAVVMLAGLAADAVAQDAMFRDPQTAVSVFAGQMTNDGWETVVLSPTEADYLDSHLGAAILSMDWALWDPRLRVGVEGQVVQHWGGQDHIEFNVPATIRYRALDPVIAVQGASFGLGLSYATETPQIEVDRKGDSQRWLAHWYAEIEFGKPDWAVYPFLRLHHRSDGYVIADFDTGSNAVVFGLRAPF